jgi:flagellar protein FliS
MTSPTTADLAQYRRVSAEGSVVDADPHRVIHLLLKGALDRLAQARGHMQRGEASAKSEQIGKALGIIEGLKLNLDIERGGDIASNLNDLYDYIMGILLKANLDNDVLIIDEVGTLLREVEDAWGQITPASNTAV